METLIVVNPKAREGEMGRRWPALEKQLLEVLGERSARVAFTTAADHGSKTVREAIRAGARRIVVVGGDGTVSECLQGFFDEPTAEGAARNPISPEAVLCVMPAGRGDDFFKTIAGREFKGADAGWARGLELLRKGSAKPMDAGLAELKAPSGAARRYFINVSSFGYSALVVHRVLNRVGFWGKGRFAKSALTYPLQSVAAMSQYKPIAMTVKVDGAEIYTGPIYAGFVLNGKYNGGGMSWSSRAAVDDGILEVLVSEPRSPLATVATASRMISGEWDGVKGIHIGRGRVIEADALPDARWDHPLAEIDGDQPEKPGTRGVRFEVLPGAIRVWR